VNPLLEARKRWMAHAPDAAAQSVSIGLLGSYTVDPMVPYLGDALVQLGLEPKIEVAPFNQLIQGALDPAAAFDGDLPQTLAFVWRIEDLFALPVQKIASGDAASIEDVLVGLEQFADAIARLRENFTGTIVVGIPPCPTLATMDVEHLAAHRTLTELHRKVTDRWLELVGDIKRVGIVDLDAIERAIGTEGAHDPRKWYLYRQPYRDVMHNAVAQSLSRTLRLERGSDLIKCLVVDCDNTLWGGVVGEDGIEGIALSEDFPGSAYLDFQRQLVALQKTGLFITLVSKNNEADVMEVFDRHDAMVLKREHLATWRINWNAKSDNITEIANELNIGLDAIAFIDDSSFEIDEVRARVPEVYCHQVPEDVALFPKSIRELRMLERSAITTDDRQRTKLVQAEKKRLSAKGTISEEEFLKTQGLRVTVGEATPGQYDRVAQLINKTNQFNLTTKRRTRDEVEALAQSSDYRIYFASASDRFGDFGLIGVVVVECSPAAWHIDTLLLSCRALGRKVETAVISWVRDDAVKTGVTQLTGEFIETPKNAPARSFFPDHGFAPDGGSRFGAACGDIPPCPDFIDLQGFQA